MSNQLVPDTSPPDRDQVSSEYLHSGPSESSTTSSGTDADPSEPATAGAEQSEAAAADRGASGADTDATTCDTVSATMWFDRPEVATSFVTCDVSDDDDDDDNDDDDDTVNSNNDEDGIKTETDEFLPRFMECRRCLAMRILSARLSVKRVYCDKTKKNQSRFLHHTKEHLS